LIAEELMCDLTKTAPPMAPKMNLGYMMKLMRKNTTIDLNAIKKEYIPLKWTKLKETNHESSEGKNQKYPYKCFYKYSSNLLI
jgi:hypothetical protein